MPTGFSYSRQPHRYPPTQKGDQSLQADSSLQIHPSMSALAIMYSAASQPFYQCGDFKRTFFVPSGSSNDSTFDSTYSQPITRMIPALASSRIV
jgi:hypothetical protein